MATPNSYVHDELDFKRSDDLCRVSFRLRGFRSADRDRDGNFTVQAMMKIATAGEWLYLGDCLDMSLLGCKWTWKNKATTFSISFDMQVSDAMYNSKILKSQLLCDVSLFYFGKSSMKYFTRFFVEENPHQPILSYVHHIASVDFITRKPLPWPASMGETFKGRHPQASDPDQSSKRTEKIPRPAHTFIFSVYVTWSETDGNAHCNFASYTKFADDALRAALRIRQRIDGGDATTTAINHQCHQLHVSKLDNNEFFLYQDDPSLALKGFRKGFMECGVKETKTHYFNECLEDDLLHVHIWQDGVKDNVVFTSIEKNNKVAAQIVTEYFTSKSKL